jgi:fructokinase
MNNGARQRPVVFGEVLYDCFPDGSVVLGGAPFNVAWHLQAFGMAPLFISRVGDDALGHRIRDTMHSWEMDTSGLQLDSSRPTGKVDIAIDNGEPHFNIVADQAYDFIDASAMPPLPDGALLYHGSLALRNAVSRHALQELKAGHELQVLVDVNLRDPWWQRDSILALLEGARWVKLNEHELAVLVPQEQGLPARMRYFRQTYSPELLIVTRGAAGALALTASGEELPVVPSVQAGIVDTVGAGDAFTSVITLGLLRDWALPLVLERAQAFASAVVGIRGATVSDPEFYKPFIDQWELA